jgi:predicted deacetylase
MSSFLLVLHDVAPETWSDYRRFVEEVDALGPIPMTWLVVPDFHNRQPLEAHSGLRRRLEERLARGDELALHGYFHQDDGAAPRTPGDWLMRRIYTREGEFYRLEEAPARQRLERGMGLFQRLGWPLHGFVAPAWLMSDGTRRVLRDSGLSYTSGLHHLYRLPDFQALAAPGLTWSARSAWRRGVSRLVCAGTAALHRQAPVVRLGLHPVDMRHEFSRVYWLRLLRRMLEDGRRPLTKIDWLRQQEQGASAAA